MIGVLSVTVVLLMVIILVMVKRNKQKVFNKHSKMFKTPLVGKKFLNLSNALDIHGLSGFIRVRPTVT